MVEGSPLLGDGPRKISMVCHFGGCREALRAAEAVGRLHVWGWSSPVSGGRSLGAGTGGSGHGRCCLQVAQP